MTNMINPKNEAGEAAMLGALAERFDEIFTEIPFLRSFTVKYGASWDPHIPSASFELAPAYDAGVAVSSEATRVIRDMALQAMLDTGVIVYKSAEEEGSEYVAGSPGMKSALEGAVFTQGARVSLPIDAALATALKARKSLAR